MARCRARDTHKAQLSCCRRGRSVAALSYTLSRSVCMEDPQEQAGRWRLRADEIRTIARSMRRSFARCSLLDVADQWERMAESAERRAGLAGVNEPAAKVDDRV
jgi:hypothetical protein